MAEQGYGCIWGDCTNKPAVILTDLTNGASVSLCEEHEAPGLIPILAANIGVDPGEFYTMIEKYLAREARKAERALADARAADAAQGSEGPTPPVGDGGQDDGDDDASGAALPMDNGSKVVTER